MVVDLGLLSHPKPPKPPFPTPRYSIELAKVYGLGFCIILDYNFV